MLVRLALRMKVFTGQKRDKNGRTEREGGSFKYGFKIKQHIAT